MITIKEFPDKHFSTKEEMFKALRENKETLIAQKKMMTKEADSVCCIYVPKNNKGETIKGEIDISSISELKMDLVINTTKVMDSHSDVHMNGIWSKSIKEQKNLYLIQEHKMSFNTIITDDVKANTKEMNWKDVGASYTGKTEALIFSVNVEKDRNPFMFETYAKGFVKNHSVGMRYIKIDLAIDSEADWDKEEKEIWDKYISDVANKEDAEAQGFFWAVTEAKIIEGSAVPVGSNKFTPTLNIESKEAADKALQKEAAKALQEKKQIFFN